MATLILEFHCMCLWVPNETAGSVHVLMPDTRHSGHDPHEVRIRQGAGEGLLMEGLELVLRGNQRANTSLVPSRVTQPVGELPDLSKLPGSNLVDPDLLTTKHPANVVSRVTLLSGGVFEILARGTLWHLGGKDRVLSHQVTWIIGGLEKLEWQELNGSGATAPVQLSDLTPEPGTKDVFRVEIHHVLKGTLTHPGNLSPEEVRHHFAAFYGPLGVSDLNDDLLPSIPDFEGSPDFKCVGAQASIK